MPVKVQGNYFLPFFRVMLGFTPTRASASVDPSSFLSPFYAQSGGQSFCTKKGLAGQGEKIPFLFNAFSVLTTISFFRQTAGYVLEEGRGALQKDS